MNSEAWKKLIFGAINLEALAFGLIDNALEPALKSVVEKSANKIDDALFAMIYPTLEAELKKIISEQIATLKA